MKMRRSHSRQGDSIIPQYHESEGKDEGEGESETSLQPQPLTTASIRNHTSQSQVQVPLPESGGSEDEQKSAPGQVNETTENFSYEGDNQPSTPGAMAKILSMLHWMPRRCRYDPENPPDFTLSMNILLGFSTTFTIANLYYPQPILNIIAEDFNVSYERSSTVAALSQAGYATGLLLICPLADMVRRRALILCLIFATATMWIGLCLTNNFNTFLAISYLCGVGTVTPQLMLPLVGDLVPPNKRASSLSIVVSGLALGLLIARVLSGIVANYTSWRNIYWFALGAQYLTFALLFCVLSDYPVKNKGLNYFRGLWEMAVMVVHEPLLAQACAIGFLLSACFTSFWTTLTFLLASPPFNYSSLQIGLFAFIGITVVTLVPVWSRLVTDRFVFLFSVVLGLSVMVVGIVISTFIGSFTVGGPIIQAILADSGANFAHTANRSNIYNLDPKARNRINTAYMVFSFAGQLTGTAVGNRLYAQGGWVWSGSCNIAFIGTAIIIGIIRGPRETGWIGWHGGWNIRKDDHPAKEAATPPEQIAEEALSPTTEK
ncbi:major facilitator superfamily domain-containing protein [Camillea tinctor]|nr:major facilitator superfamily domain-containing protein [Camillea tinctor]